MPSLNVEHFACNVSDPVAMAAWYVKNLGMRVVRSNPTPPHVHFLADAASRVVIEIYNNPGDAIPDYPSQHPLRFHLAFSTDDLEGVKSLLVEAGATYVDEMNLADGSRLLMLRDPWGLPIQLANRKTPLL